MINLLKTKMIEWLKGEKPGIAPIRASLTDFDRLRHIIHPCDILLVEGRSRVSRYIQAISGSPWSHAALYIGHIQDIDDPLLKRYLSHHYKGDLSQQLVIESELDTGTAVVPITKYETKHIRVARPQGITHADAQRVIGYAINRLGSQYDIKNIFELAALFMPRWLMAKKFFNVRRTKPSNTQKEICSTMIAEAFASIHFPILPLVRNKKEGGKEFIARHPRLITPSDFDFSPFFEIIKYPIVGIAYKHLDWGQEEKFCDENYQELAPVKDDQQKNKKI